MFERQFELRRGRREHRKGVASKPRGVVPALLRAGLGRALGAAVLLCSSMGPAVLAQAPTGGLLDPGSSADVASLLRLAEQGDARAAFLIGMRYALGRDTERDDSLALLWLGKAADGGLAEAQYNLGVIHASGRGVPPDLGQAARWYAAAADQGLARAQYNLGTLYALGVGVDRDEVQAARWFRRAAEQGVAQAAYNLGVLYEYGRGVREDPEEAAAWYRRAIDGGSLPAGKRLAALNVRAEEAPPVPSQAAPQVAPEESSRAPSTGDWLASRDPTHYTLQILSHTDEASVRRFVESRFPGGEARYFAFDRDGVIWYSVIYGDYPSARDAREAIATLDAGLQALEPWVRRMAVIQKRAIR